jgi:lipopolysaccharide transport system ATP-binding protein
VDEVLAVGDAQFQKKCMGKMGEVARGGRTVLFVSHNMAAVQWLCQKAIRLRAGQLQGFGPVDEEVRAYQEEVLSVGVGNGVRQLSDEVVLCGLTCSPQTLESGQEVRFGVSLRALSPLKLDHLALLLHSSVEVRVAIIDLRRSEGPYALEEGQVLTVEVKVDHLNLVEGEYRLGLHLQGGRTSGDYMDAGQFEVLPRRLTGGVVPYHVGYRGYVELGSSICDLLID